jgi:hypothetical protein
MSVESPRQTCAHRWALDVSPRLQRNIRCVQPIIDFRNPNAMKPGKVYACLDCPCRVRIKHRLIAMFDYHIYCNCGFGYSEIMELDILAGHILGLNGSRSVLIK